MSKIEKLYRAHSLFSELIAAIPDDRAKELASIDVREFVAKTLEQHPELKPSNVAAGLEQSWRETPRLIRRISIKWRPLVSKAWNDATLSAYPEFLAREKIQLQKVIERGRIRTEAEFHRVSHEIDVLEGEDAPLAQMQLLYSLIDAFQAKPR